MAFYSAFLRDISEINEDFESARERLIQDDPWFYKLKMLRAFNIISEGEEQNMTFGLFARANVVLEEVLRLWHAPYLNKND